MSESREQKVLAALLLEADRAVPVARLVDAVWDAEPPRSAAKAVQNSVANLRGQFRAGGVTDEVITTEQDGYALRVGAGRLDRGEFDELIKAARAQAGAGEVESAVGRFREALGIWRGAALSGVKGLYLRAAADRLDEQRLAVQEECLGYEIALNRSRERVDELTELVEAYPLRESLRRLQMVALFHSGRRAEALEVYRRGREILVSELGVEPGAELAEVHRAILDGTVPLDIAAPRIQKWPSTKVVPHQLPADVPRFTGRARQLQRLDELLGRAAGTVVTAITGMAGVGKTSLAIHWAHRVREQFGDGELYVNLRGYDRESPVAPEQVLDGFLRALGVPRERIPREPAELAALYRSLVAERRMLIVLDNAVNAEQVRPLLPGGSACVVLLTSRSQLSGLVVRDGAERVNVDGLPADEAAALIARIVGAERVGDDVAAELAAMCAYLPLALRIAAERIAARPHLDVPDLIDELAKEQRRLDLLSTVDDETSAVRVVFSWSYRALPDPAARAFRLLGLHAGPDFSSHAAAALLATGGAATRRLLEQLTGVHLLEEIDLDRFRFHDLVRVYAAERVFTEESEQSRAEAVRRELEWYLYTADKAVRTFSPPHLRAPLGSPIAEVDPMTFKRPGNALRWCEAERANFVAGINQAVELGMDDIGWKLPATLWEFFNTRKYWSDWIGTHQVGLDAARRIGDRVGESWLLNNLGPAYLDLGDTELAIEYFQRTLVIRREINDREAEGWTQYNLGDAYRVAGWYPEAIEHLRAALVIGREFDERWGLSWTLTMLGDTYRKLGRFDEAVECLQQALEIRRGLKADDPWGEGWTLTMLGDAYRGLGRFNDAIDNLQRALAISRESGLLYLEGRTLRGLGDAFRRIGQPAQARESWRQALKIFDESNDRRAAGVRARLEALAVLDGNQAM